jgi:predicted secreted protein
MLNWASQLAVYFVIWWLTLFLVLPWGNRAIDTDDVAKGQDAGSPRRPRLWQKMAVNTVIAGIVWALLYAAFASGVISLHPS